MLTQPAAIDYATVPGSGLASPHAIIQPIDAVLDVIAVVSNPVRYRSRYDLYRAFARHVQNSGARLWTVECAYGDRPFEVTTGGNPQHIQVRTDHEVWAKENLVNIGIGRLPRESRYIAWVDADLTFINPQWVQETIQQLQHFDVVQMFAEAHDIDPDGTVLNSFRSFGWSHVHGIPRKRRVAPKVAAAPAGTTGTTGTTPQPAVQTFTASVKSRAGASATVSLTDPNDAYYGGDGRPPGGGSDRISYYHHPGFAWACRRSALNTLGCLFDVAVVGEADYIMAKSIVGEGLDVLYPGVSPGYHKAVIDWQSRALKLRGNVGFVPGAVIHHWHGRKVGRKYWDRCKILTDTRFDPSIDLKKDCEGLWQLVDHGDARSVLLRDSIRAYFRQRREDSIDV